MAGSSVINPTGMTFLQFADAVILGNGSIPRPRDEAHWKDWAARYYAVTSNVPSPLGFSGWKAWAMAGVEFQ